jgi:hypothetical protein
MCNDYEQHVRWAEYRKMMQALDLGFPTEQSDVDCLSPTTSASMTRLRPCAQLAT